jgi:Tol biopolymer transport system component
MRRFTATACALALVGSVAAQGDAADSAGPHRGHKRSHNGRIVFQRYVGDIQQLFTINPNGTGIRQVTHATQTSEYGHWSPDGAKILFDRSPIGTGNQLGTLHTVNANGRRDVALTANLAAAGRFAVTPAWSPNGRRVAFRLYTVVRPFSDGIWVMNVNGGGLRQVTRGDPGLATAGPDECDCDEGPSFSPDGRQMTFTRVLNANRAAVFVVRVDGSHLRRLTRWGLDAGDPKWSPDGSRIVYHTYIDPHPGKSSNLFTIRPDGRRTTQLTHHRNGNGNSAYAAWSPDGRFLVFARNPVSLPTHSRNELYIMLAKGGRARRLTHLAQYDAAKPDWGTAP